MNVSRPTLLIVGSGEAFDVGLGNTSYLFRGNGYPKILFDCGYQIPERLWEHALHTNLDAICFTHLHADHSFGIVPLLVRFGEENRRAPLQIIGPRGTERFVLKLLDMGYPGFRKRIRFRLQFLTLNPRTTLHLKGLTFRCAPTVHSVLNYTIRVDLEGEHLSFAVSGDGQITPASRQLVADVDVLFQEVYSEKSGIPVHADLQTISKWIRKSRIKKIVTAHFSRLRKGILAKQVEQKRDRCTQWIVSKPNREISLLG